MMSKPQPVIRLVATAVALCGVLAAVAQAGDLSQLNMRWEGPQPGSYPVNLKVEVYKSDNDLQGTSTATFDGVNLSNVVCDAIACITAVEIAGGNLVIHYTANGYRNDGYFDTETSFKIYYDGVLRSFLKKYHTSCSRPVWIERPLAPFSGAGTFFVEGGTGSCVYEEGECPDTNKIFWLRGQFSVPCTNPGNITVNLYDDHGDFAGSSTAYFDGTSLMNTTCGNFVCIEQAGIVAGNLLVGVDFYGYMGNGEFGPNTGFELVVEGCGTFLLQFHTSCSQPVLINYPYPTTNGGFLRWMNGCGGCLNLTVPTIESSWGGIKSLYQ